VHACCSASCPELVDGCGQHGPSKWPQVGNSLTMRSDWSVGDKAGRFLQEAEVACFWGSPTRVIQAGKAATQCSSLPWAHPELLCVGQVLQKNCGGVEVVVSVLVLLSLDIFSANVQEHPHGPGFRVLLTFCCFCSPSFLHQSGERRRPDQPPCRWQIAT
jgi:hypothetical protein